MTQLHPSPTLSSARVARRSVLAPVLVVALALTLVLGLAGRAGAATPPPSQFMGVSAWDPLNGADFARLNSAHVHVYRLLIRWDRVESHQPTGDCATRCTHRYNWAAYDRVFIQAGLHNVRVMPVLAASPSWAASRPGYQPTTASTKAAFAQFTRAAALRYGPQGTLWSRSPWSASRPAPANVRAVNWQVWNEPNTTYNWQPRPSPAAYAYMLLAESRVLRSVSPSIRVWAAGLPWPTNGIDADAYLAALVRRPGVLGAVDGFAIHPYAVQVPYVMNRVYSARSALDSNGAGSKPLWITEIGWASGTPDGGFQVTEGTQASNLQSLYRQLLAARTRLKLRGCVWFSYRDRTALPGQTDYWGYRSGLLRTNGSPKPSWTVFSRIATSGY